VRYMRRERSQRQNLIPGIVVEDYQAARFPDNLDESDTENAATAKKNGGLHFSKPPPSASRPRLRLGESISCCQPLWQQTVNWSHRSLAVFIVCRFHPWGGL
ncbi:MAG: hypothetical protein WBW37_03295, partial [Methyloceanibacter sp.]